MVWRLSKGGGIPVVVREVAARLDPARFEVHVATVRPPFDEDDLDRLPACVALHHLGFTGRLSRRDRSRAAWALLRLTRRLRPDVLHLHSGTASYSVPAAVSVRGMRRVLEVHDAPGNGRHGRATEWLECLLSRRLGFVPLAHSTSVTKEVARFCDLPASRVELVPLGIDTSRMARAPRDPAEWRARHGISPQALLVLYVARLVTTKNGALFVDVARRVVSDRGAKGIVFALVGTGPEKESLAERVRQDGLDDTVRLLGACYDDDLVTAFHACDVFLSTSDYEGFGLAVVEAMAAGKPTVATAVGGVTDLVEDDRTGILAPRGDLNALAEGVSKLLDDEALRTAIGRAASLRARSQFDISTTVAGYAALYERLTAHRGGNPHTDRGKTVFVLKTPTFGPVPLEPGAGRKLPYGVDRLAEHQLRLRWSDAHAGPPWTSPPIRVGLRHLQRLGPPVMQTVLALPAIAHSDATLAMFESEGNLLAWLRRIGAPGARRPALLVLSCWLAELLPHLSERRLRWYRRTYQHVDRLLFFSSNQQEIFDRYLGLPAERLRFVPFGVDDEAFRPSRLDDGFVLAAGRDRGRDWGTLFEALAIAGVPAKVLCRPGDIEGQVPPRNVEVLGYVDHAAYRDLLARCRLSVVASRPLAYPTGQTVVLESMATSKCCVTTSIPSMADYLDPGANALSVPAADAGALADALVEAYDDEGLRDHIGAGGRLSVERHFNDRRMWDAVAAEIHAVTH